MKKNQFFEKVSKTDKPPGRLNKKKERGYEFLIQEMKEGTLLHILWIL